MQTIQKISPPKIWFHEKTIQNYPKMSSLDKTPRGMRDLHNPRARLCSPLGGLMVRPAWRNRRSAVRDLFAPAWRSTRFDPSLSIYPSIHPCIYIYIYLHIYIIYTHMHIYKYMYNIYIYIYIYSEHGMICGKPMGLNELGYHNAG